MKKVVIVSLLIMFLVSGCMTEIDFDAQKEKLIEEYNEEHDSNYSQEEVEELMEEYEEEIEEYEGEENVEEEPEEIMAAPSIDEIPTVTAEADPANLSLPNSFDLTITAEDDIGVSELSFVSTKIFWNHEKTGGYNCTLDVTCTNTWNLVSWEEGLHEITVVAIDSSGQESEEVLVEVDVHPYEDIEVEETIEEEEEEPECNSNSDCGYKEVCSSTGSCKSVDCTTDSHCSGCKRCSSNSCVSCGSGPYGCYC